MIRWKFLAIRIALVVLFFLFIRFTAGPIAQFVMVRTLQQATGSRVEVASTQIDLLPPRIHVYGVAVADPRKEFRNLFELGEAHFAIDGSALLRRRYEVSSAKLSGLRIGGSRQSSGKLEIEEEKDEAVTEEDSGIAELIERFGGDIESQGEAFLKDLQTVGEAKRIRGYWEEEYAVLRTRAAQLEADIRKLRDTAKGVSNPLRDLPALQESLRQSEQIKKELVSVKQRLDSMPARVRSDMVALKAAKERDKERITEMLPLDMAGKGGELGPELLGDIVRAQIREIQTYVDSGKRIAEITVATPKTERIRGETVPVGGDRGPGWMIRRCEVDGFLSMKSHEYSLVGVVENLSDGTSAKVDPLHARLRLEGPEVVRVDYTRFADGSHGPTPKSVEVPAARDLLKIHWPEVRSPLRRIGSPEKVALMVEGGPSEMWIEVEIQGDDVQGRVVSKQPNAKVKVVAKERWQNSPLVGALEKSLSELDHLEFEAQFQGTWRRMDMKVATNLSTKLGEGLQLAAAESMNQVRGKLASGVESEYQRQLQDLEVWLASQQGEARKIVAKADELVESVGKKAVAELGVPDAYLGRFREGFKGIVK